MGQPGPHEGVERVAVLLEHPRPSVLRPAGQRVDECRGQPSPPSRHGFVPFAPRTPAAWRGRLHGRGKSDESCRWPGLGSKTCPPPLSEPIRGRTPRPVEPTSLVRASGLRKAYGDFEAVRGIDLDVRPGEAFGFLGPNGAGKSSTMRMIAAVSPPSGGELRILGMDPATQGPQIRARIGVCPQEDTLDTELSIRDNLVVYGRYFGLSRAEASARADELLQFFQLAEKAKAKVEALSGGMKRRLTIARSLINQPDLLLLDEPTTGLDPQARHLLWDKLFRLKQEGVTLVLTTHYMDEAEQLCDRLVVMDKGRIVAEGSPLSLIREHSTREVTELRFGVGQHEARAEQVAGLAAARRGAARPAAALHRRRRGDARPGARARPRPGGGAGPPLHPGGRLPPPHRPDAGRLMGLDGSTDAGRARDAGAADHARTAGRLLGHRLPAHLARLGVHLVRDAAVLRVRDGRPARRLRRRRVGRPAGRPVVPRLHRPRPGRRARDERSPPAR